MKNSILKIVIAIVITGNSYSRFTWNWRFGKNFESKYL